MTSSFVLMISLVLLLIFSVFTTSTLLVTAKSISQSDTSSSFDAPPIIHNVSCLGSVQGIWETVINTETGETRKVAKFMGIPFALPPNGTRRFKAPEPYICVQNNKENHHQQQEKPYNATYNRPPCPQFNNYGEGPDVIGSEDCLYLDIYVPEKIYFESAASNNNTHTNSKKFPVNLYQHGGSNMFGFSKMEKHGFFTAFYGEAYNDTYGCVGVVINYRLSLLGYMMAPSFGPDDVNFGIQDTILSAKWVQQNIASFGGDVNRITTSGQSSGGTNIFALVASPKIKGIFKAMYSMSGSVNISMQRRDKILQDLPIVEALGCGSDAKNQIECLQAVPLQELFKHVPASWSTPSLCLSRDLNPTGKHYVGLPFVDGNIIAMSFAEALRVGMNSEVTLIMSGMGQECNLFPTQQDLINYTLPQWKQYLNEHVFQNFGPSVTPKVSEAVFNQYLPEATQSAVDLALFSLSADYGVQCGNIKLSKLAGTSTPIRRSNLYLSVNQWPPNFPNNQGMFSYAFHIWDYLTCFHMWYELLEFEKFVPHQSDYDLSKLMRSQWYVLMNTGSLETWTNPFSSFSSNNSTSDNNNKWLPAGQHPNFPNEWNTFVYSRPDRFPFLKESQMITSYKSKNCQTLESFGIDDRFWWCN